MTVSRVLGEFRWSELEVTCHPYGLPPPRVRLSSLSDSYRIQPHCIPPTTFGLGKGVSLSIFPQPGNIIPQAGIDPSPAQSGVPTPEAADKLTYPTDVRNWQLTSRIFFSWVHPHGLPPPQGRLSSVSDSYRLQPHCIPPTTFGLGKVVSLSIFPQPGNIIPQAGIDPSPAQSGVPTPEAADKLTYQNSQREL